MNHYETLGVSKAATPDEIKSVYRKLAKQYHPDVNPGDATAEAKFKEIGSAYEVLSSPSKKAIYDNGGDNRQPQNNGAPSGFPGDFNFGDFNFGGFAFGGFQQQPNNDIQVVIKVSAEETIKPYNANIDYVRTKPCVMCAGTGGVGKPINCLQCHGQGFIAHNGSIASVCPRCNGKKVVYDQNCRKCQGFGLEKENAKLNIKIEKPIAWVQYSFDGAGNQTTPKERTGKVVVIFDLLPHSNFSFERYDCTYHAKVDPIQAILGCKIKVPTIDGIELDYNIPEYSEPNRTESVGAYGLNAPNNTRGNFFVRVFYDVPQNLSEEKKQILQKYVDLNKSEKGD